MNGKRIAVIGAGPVGLEAALYGAHLGYDVRVFEAGRVGEHLMLWGHVRLFSPFALNHSPLGAAAIVAAGGRLPESTAYTTGREHVESYLEPLARTPALAGRVRERVVVRQIGRERIGKAGLSGAGRAAYPFRLLLDGPAGEAIETADVVIDASGTYGQPNWMGDGNVPALGERRLRARIDYALVDPRGADRPRFEGRRTLVVGSGHSAATALDALLGLDGVSIVWATRHPGRAPYAVHPEDPLPERDRLARLGNALAAGSDPRVTFHDATVVDRLEEHGEQLAVELRGPGGADVVVVDRVLSHVGFSPDNSLYRELQVHECYASFGPMSLAAALLGEGGDCLSQTPKGPESLANPEPEFFLLGAKSYGRNTSFLVRIGIAQVRDVFRLIERRPALDLYAA